jgi:ATP-dependent exoDNAse (exonuclease V) beta subunit
MRQRLETGLAHLELAHIGTIHAFCGDILHERPVEAGVDLLYKIAAEDDARGRADTAFDRWLQQVLAKPPEGVRRVLRRRPPGANAHGPREDLRNAFESLIYHRDFPAAWRRDPFDRDREIDLLLERLSELGKLAASSSRQYDYLTVNFKDVARFVAENASLESVRGRDYDGLEAALRGLAGLKSWRWKGAKQTRFGPLSRDEVLARRDLAKIELDRFLAASDADLAPRLHEELRPAIAAYDEIKARAGCLDFLDLLIKASHSRQSASPP